MPGVPQLARLGPGPRQRALQAAAVRSVQLAGRQFQPCVVEVVPVAPRRRIHGVGRGAFVHVVEADVQPLAVRAQAGAVVGAGPGVEAGLRVLVEVHQRPVRAGPRIAAVGGNLVAPVAHVAEGAEVEQQAAVAERERTRIGDRGRDLGARAPGGDGVGLFRHQVYSPVGAVTVVEHVQMAAGVAPDDRREVVIVAAHVAQPDRLRPAAVAHLVGDGVWVAAQLGVLAAGGVVDDVNRVIVPQRLRAHAQVVDHLLGAVAGERPCRGNHRPDRTRIFPRRGARRRGMIWAWQY